MVLAFRLRHMCSLNGFGDSGEICYNRMGPHYSIISCLLKHLTKKIKLKNVTRRFDLSHTIIKRNVKFQTLLFGKCISTLTIRLTSKSVLPKVYYSYRQDRYISPSPVGFSVVLQDLQKSSKCIALYITWDGLVNVISILWHLAFAVRTQ